MRTDVEGVGLGARVDEGHDHGAGPRAVGPFTSVMSRIWIDPMSALAPLPEGRWVVVAASKPMAQAERLDDRESGDCHCGSGTPEHVTGGGGARSLLGSCGLGSVSLGHRPRHPTGSSRAHGLAGAAAGVRSPVRSRTVTGASVRGHPCARVIALVKRGANPVRGL